MPFYRTSFIALLYGFIYWSSHCLSAQTASPSLHAASLPQYEEDALFVQFKNPNSITTWHGNTVLGVAAPICQYITQRYSPCTATVAFPRLSYVPKLAGIVRLQLANPEQIEEVLRYLQTLPQLDYAERVPLYHTFYTPNDLHANQWHLSHIAAPAAWDIHTGGSNVTVAIVDDGVLTNHEDLSANIVAGFDVADNDPNPSPPAGATGNCFSHGTHCAGIVSAVTDNGTGIASLGGQVRIMPIKTKPDTDLGNNCNSLPHTISGIEYAIAQQADIISMSFGGYVGSNAIQALFDQAHAQGIICVAAAGNDNTNEPSYPASYNHVISVAASNPNDQKAAFSNYGATIDVAAPGTSIYSTIATNTSEYGTKQGTSMACPLVASLCALMLSYQPNLTPDELENCLKTACDNINAQNPTLVGQLGAGRVNAQQALACLQPEPIAQFSFLPNAPCVGQSVQFNDLTAGNSVLSRTWTFEGGNPATATVANPIVAFADNGTHNITLSVTNSAGTNTVTQTINVQQSTALLSGSTTINIGNSAILTLSMSGTPPFIVSYTDGINSFVLPNINSNSYSFTVSPTITTTYSLSTMSSSGACIGAVSGTATVNVVPSGGGTPLPIAIDTVGAICRNASPFLLTANPEGGVFTGNGIANPTIGLFDPQLAGIGTHAIVYSYLSPDGNTYSTTREIVVWGENIVTSGNRFICSGEAIQLQAQGGSNYQWLPDSNIEQPNTATPVVFPMTTTVYTVVSTDVNGCQSSAAVTVAVNPAPYFPTANNDTTFCQVSSVTLPLTDVLPLANYTYIWFPSNGVAEPDMPNSMATVSESTAYSLIITDENGCQAVRNITIRLGNPAVQINPTTATLCADGGALLSVNGNNLAQYAWSNGATTQSTAVHTAAQYAVTVTDTEGCTDSAAVAVSEAATISVRIAGSIIAEGNNTTLLRTDPPYSQYVWSDGSTDAQIVASVGAYSVTVSDANGCTGTASTTVRYYDPYTLSMPTAFSPNNDGINDEWYVGVPGDVCVSYAVYNRWGQVVFDTADANVPIWNGKRHGIPCEQGVYVVVARVAFADGEQVLRRSTITLLR